MQTDIFSSTSSLEDIIDESEDEAYVFSKEENEKCAEYYRDKDCPEISNDLNLLFSQKDFLLKIAEIEENHLQQRIADENQIQTKNVEIEFMRRFKEIKRICFKKMNLKDISPYTTKIKKLLKDIRNISPESNNTAVKIFLAKQSQPNQKPNQYMQMNIFPSTSRQEDVIDDANMFSKEDEKYSEYFRQEICPVMLSDYSIDIIDKVCLLKIAGADIPEIMIKKEQKKIKNSKRFEIILAKRKSKKQQKLQERIAKNNLVQTINVDTKAHKLTSVVPENDLLTKSIKSNLMRKFNEKKRECLKKIRTTVSNNEFNVEDITLCITPMREFLKNIGNDYPEETKTACIKYLEQKSKSSTQKNDTAQKPNQYTEIRKVAEVFNLNNIQTDIFPSTSRLEAESEVDPNVFR